MVQETQDPDATLIVDAFHNWNSESVPETLRNIPAEKISHYHIDDCRKFKNTWKSNGPRPRYAWGRPD